MNLHLDTLKLMLTRILTVVVFFIVLPAWMNAQETDTVTFYNYSDKKDFEIGGIKVTGNNYSDENAIISISGLRIGDKIRIPSNTIAKAIKGLWKLRLFTDVQILIEKTIGDVVFMEILVQERPRLSKFSYTGVKKSLHDNLNEEVNRYLLKGGIVTDNIKVNSREAIEEYFVGKGYLDANVVVRELADSSRVNSVQLVFDVERGPRVKIDNIYFEGNETFPDKK
ncbi:MAG: outer membrane protein assembly factor BamA, partial [Bacteroidota bacterium]